MDPLQQQPPAAPHRRGRLPRQQPPPQQPPPPPRPTRRPPQQPQQYPYNPTLQHDLTHYNPTNGIESLFRNASITKVIVLFTIVYYFLQQNTNNNTSFNSSSSSSWYSNTNSNNNHENETINVFKILLRPYSNSYYQYIISKMIFFLSSNNRSSSTVNHTTTIDEHSNHPNSNNSTVILIMNVLYQFYLYRIIERQMSSYQLIRFLVYVMIGTIVVEYIFTYVVLQYTLVSFGIQRRNTLLDVVMSSSSSSSFLYGPYSIIGALSLYYHWYIPRIYPRFVTILSIFHCSEKSIFYFYTIYFIIINNNNNHTTSSSTNMRNHNHDNQQVLFNVLYGYRGTINVIVSMSLGMILSILYYYLSNHPIIVKYDQWVYHRIIQPTIQRFNHTIATATTTTNHRTNNNNNNNNLDRRNTATNNTNHRVAQPPQIPPPQLRQRYNTATTAAAAAAAAAIDNNPWRIPHGNNVNDDDETDQMNRNAAVAATIGGVTGGMNHDDIPLLPIENVDMEAIEQLCHMGFERNNVIMALQQSHNNIEHAANRLLSSSTTTGTSD